MTSTAHATYAVGREKIYAHLAMILFASMIAGSFSLAKLALPYVDPVPLNAVRFLIGSVLMGAFTFGIRRNPFVIPVAPWRYAILGGLMAIYFVSMFIALTMTTPVSTSAVFTLMPIMTAFFAFLILKQVVRPIVGLSLAFAGIGSVWVIFHGELAAILSFDIGRGEMIFFGGCVSHAVFAALLRKFTHSESLMVANFFIVASIAAWLIIYGVGEILTTDWTALPPVAWGVLFYLGFFTTIVTFLLMQYSSHRLPASKVLAYGYLVPAFVILYEGLSGQGWASISVLIGALVTILGLIVLALVPDS